MRDKKILALLLAVCVMCGVSISVVLAANPFVDVDANKGYSEYVVEAERRGLFNGIGDYRFAPESSMTRAMLVTVLWRMEGKPQVKADGFEDVSPETYYYEAVSWAKAEEIVNGMDPLHFGPNISVTREQMVTILARYATYLGYGLEERHFADFTDIAVVSKYAEIPIRWAVSNELLRCSDGLIRPREAATRAEVAACLVSALDHWGIEFVEDAGTDATVVPGSSVPENPQGTEKPSAGSDSGTSGGMNTETAYIVVENVTAKPGDKTVEVAVSLKNNPGILGMLISISYDETVMTLSKALNGDAFGDVLTLTKPKKLSNGCNFLWYGQEVYPEQIKDGTVLLLYFDVADNSKSGNYEIEICCADEDVVDNNLELIPVIVENGSIAVS